MTTKKLFNKYWWIAKRLQTQQLQKDSSSDMNFSDEDLFNLDLGKRGGNYFLGYYSEEGINLALRKYGVFKRLNRKGFKNVLVTIDTSDVYKHRIVFHNEKKNPENLLIDLVLRKQFFEVSFPFENDLSEKSYHSLVIDWLCMQNPYRSFSKERPKLPGQNYPGLGMSEVVVELLMIICWRLNLSALMNIPEHYHNALFYSRIFYYLDPEIQAKFLALKDSFTEIPLHQISWAIDEGCVIDESNGEPLKWFVSQQIVPLDKDLKKTIMGKEYKDFVADRKRWYHFKMDKNKFESMLKKLDKENNL